MYFDTIIELNVCVNKEKKRREKCRINCLQYQNQGYNQKKHTEEGEVKGWIGIGWREKMPVKVGTAGIMCWALRHFLNVLHKEWSV